MAASEHSYNGIGLTPGRRREDSPCTRLSAVARWHLAAARGEIQRAAAVTSATWVRARDTVTGLLYDK